MILLTPDQQALLRAHGVARHAARRTGTAEPDPAPVVKLFNPCGPATWLATELDTDGDTLFGLADLGFGCPELGSFSRREIAAIHLPFRLRIERDTAFATSHPLSLWADAARRTGSIPAAERLLAATPPSHPLAPDPDPDVSGPDA